MASQFICAVGYAGLLFVPDSVPLLLLIAGTDPDRREHLLGRIPQSGLADGRSGHIGIAGSPSWACRARPASGWAD